jgi:hypothetical protein
MTGGGLGRRRVDEEGYAMRLYTPAVAAISLMVFGAAGSEGEKDRLLHIEVMPLLAAEGCAVAAWMAERYLVPNVEGGERLAYVCHHHVRRRDLEAMRAEAEAHNARVATGP